MSLKPIDMLKQALSSEEDYKRQCPLLADLIRSSKLPVCKEVVSHIKKTIKSKSASPGQKLRALKALNTLMLVGNVNLLLFTGKKIMSRLSILASHKKDQSIELRAESLFKDSSQSQENRSASVEFINCLLEYIKNWASDFGKAPDKSDSIYFTTYNKLKESGVKFPSKQPSRAKEERKVSVSRKAAANEQIEELLTLLEESSDPAMTEEYKQMLRSAKPAIENALQVAMTHENQAETEQLLNLIDRITVALAAGQRYPRLSEGKPLSSSPAYLTGSPGFRSGPEKASNFDLFDLQISPAQNSKASAFVTHQPIVLEPEHKSKNTSFTTGNLFPGSNSLFPPSEKPGRDKNSLFPEASLVAEAKPSVSLFPEPFKNEPKASLFPDHTKKEPKSSLFPEASHVESSLFPEPLKAEGRSSLFPEEKKSFEPQQSPFLEPLKKEEFSFSPNYSREDPQVAKLKLENAQMLEALEMSKKLLAERDVLIAGLQREIERLKTEKQETDEELKESLEAIDYLQQKLEKKKQAEKNAKLQNQQVLNPVKDPQIVSFFNEPARVPEKKLESNSFFDEPARVPEKKQDKGDDFDLDFILGPKKKESVDSASPAKPQVMHSPQAPQVSVVPQVAQVPVAENSLFYRMGNCMEMGVLYDSEVVQVGFQVKRQATDLLCMIFIGNKSSVPFVEVQTELSDVAMESFPILMQPLKTSEEVAQNAQTTRMIKAQLGTFTSKVPKLLVSILNKSGENCRLYLKLPLTVARFLEGRQELPTSIWNEWKKLVFEEDTSVLQLAQFSNFPEMCSFLTFTMGFCLYSNNEISDLSQVEVLAAGQFEDTLVMFLVGLTGNGTTAKFSVRCRNNALRDALAPIIKAQISK